jgi:anti-sigma factor (TIGR02949 family)
VTDTGRIDCGKALGRVWAYLDGDLSPDEAREFEQHVEHCAHCHGAHDFERKLLAAVRATEARTADPDTARLAERIRRAIRRGGAGPS